MFKINIKLIILCLGLNLFQSFTVFAQPEIIGDGWILSPAYDWKKVPIYRFIDTSGYQLDTLSVVTLEYVYPYDYDAHVYTRFPIFGWGDHFTIPTANSTHLEFYMDSAGARFFYDSPDNVLIFEYSPFPWIFRSCPGRPVFDRENNIHMIWEGGLDTLFYGYSTDTLNTITEIDTLINMPPFLRLTSSPDNSIVGAIFYDREADSLYKFLATTGEQLDFSTQPDAFYFDAYDDFPDVVIFYDIMLDWQGRICIELNKDIGNPWLCIGWGCHYFWTEEYGFRFLRPSYDDVQEGTMFEICFGPNENEILLIDSGLNVSRSKFFYSPDGGNTCYLSAFNIPLSECGSGRRIYTDTLDFVYSYNNICYYYAIPRDSILYELTETYDDEIISPLSLSLSNYPNPFNAQTTIEFTLATPSDVELTIYDITGAKVMSVARPGLDAGQHSIIWDAKDVASGVYFARLEAGGYSSSIKMVLLK